MLWQYLLAYDHNYCQLTISLLISYHIENKLNKLLNYNLLPFQEIPCSPSPQTTRNHLLYTLHHYNTCSLSCTTLHTWHLHMNIISTLHNMHNTHCSWFAMNNLTYVGNLVAICKGVVQRLMSKGASQAT